MKPYWHPLSTILLADPRCWATPALLKMFLRPGTPTRLVYAGDRMWPTVGHGGEFDVEVGEHDLVPGAAVLVSIDGVPDLLRVESIEGEMLRLAGDSCAERFVTGRENVLARALLPRARPGERLRNVRRRGLDLVEAWTKRPEESADPAATVLAKYDAQAAFYARGDDRLEKSLRERVHDAIRPGGKVLVIGSGAGHECFALARDGFVPFGVDFSPAMIEHSRKEARARELEIDFRVADIREMSLEPAALDGVLFTYDVYSFLPIRQERVAVLRSLRSALRSDGSLFLSARVRSRAYQSWILTVQWLAARGRGPGEWGGSHTRWIDTDGSLRRSFVHVFTRSGVNREIDDAGFASGEWRNGHVRLRP